MADIQVKSESTLIKKVGDIANVLGNQADDTSRS